MISKRINFVIRDCWCYYQASGKWPPMEREKRKQVLQKAVKHTQAKVARLEKEMERQNVAERKREGQWMDEKQKLETENNLLKENNKLLKKREMMHLSVRRDAAFHSASRQWEDLTDEEKIFRDRMAAMVLGWIEGRNSRQTQEKEYAKAGGRVGGGEGETKDNKKQKTVGTGVIE